MTILETLASLSSLDEFAQLTQSDDWKAYLNSLTESSDNDEIDRLFKAVNDTKGRLSPEEANAELQTLKKQVYAGGLESDELRVLLSRIAEVRGTLPLRRHETLFGRVQTTLGQMLSPGLGGTGYSNRARRARNLFTEFAGLTKIAGASTDQHGNAAGTAYDLGLDGAFSGHSVHVLHLYTGEGFDFSKPITAFEGKGFTVERLTKPGTPGQLRRWLEDADQLWLISNNRSMLNRDHLNIIREFWQRGGGLYVWGDNDPYYVDANAVLEAIIGVELKMFGNVPGREVVREMAAAAKRGFLPHLVTTGLEHLFEGITVASLDEAVCKQHGLTPLLYGSAGNLITVVRERTPTAGALMIDGAFTRLYCQWDEAGSARYVCNAACFLAAMALPEEEPEKTPAIESELLFDPSGAFQGKCDLTGKESATWLVLSVQEMGDALRNTSDAVLTDPLGFGASNTIFSDHLYDESMASWIVAQGSDPFTRKPVVECLPIVDLSSDRNLREFTLSLCKCLLAGKYLPTAARMLFFAVVDQMVDPSRKAKHRDAWEFLRKQCLANFSSTADFSESGKKLPLIEAMAMYFSPATDEMVQIRKSFATVGIIGRTLLRECRAPRGQVRTVGRRALMKVLVGDAIAAEKTDGQSLQPKLTALLYETFHGIPKLNGGRIVENWPGFARDVSRDRQRFERALEGSLLSNSEMTVVLQALTSLDLRQYTAESALETLVIDKPAVFAVWKGEELEDVRESLNDRFLAYRGRIDWDDVHLTTSPPFATTYGPSVFHCVCGEQFGNPKQMLTDDRLKKLGEKRRTHFRQVYRARGEGWYPTDGSLHCNAHRAVQMVVKEQFPEATEFSEEMLPAVAAYLREDAKGFIYDPKLESQLRFLLGSYLELRRAGQPHPEGVLTLRVKAEREQQHLR